MVLSNERARSDLLVEEAAEAELLSRRSVAGVVHYQSPHERLVCFDTILRPCGSLRGIGHSVFDRSASGLVVNFIIIPESDIVIF